MTDTEKAIRERLAVHDTIDERSRLAIDPDSLVFAPFRLVRILDTDRETIAALRRDILRLESDRDAAMQSARLAQETVERALVAGEKVRRELADFMADVRSYRATLGAAELESLPSAIARVKGELSARTEERDAARKALADLWRALQLADNEAGVVAACANHREAVEAIVCAP